MFNKLKRNLAFKLLLRMNKMTRERKPDVVLGENYLKRWHIIPENPIFNIYYHEIKRSDHDRDLHDHPYFFFSFILDGSYTEVTTKKTRVIKTGDLNFHVPWKLHRLVMNTNFGAHTIFITGPKIRKWGFQTIKGWLVSHKYIYGGENETDYKSYRGSFDGWMRSISN